MQTIQKKTTKNEPAVTPYKPRVLPKKAVPAPTTAIETPAKPMASSTSNTSLPSFNAYEKKQDSVKQQIMATQRKSLQLHQLEKKFLMQSGMAVLASGVLVLLFIFILFPTMIRFAGNIKGLTGLTRSDKIPPRVPVFTAPPVATQESTFSLAGFAEAKSTIVLIKNGQEGERTQANDNGEFSINLPLDDGENSFSLYSIDEAENESNVTKQFVISKDNQAPELTVETPEEGKTITNLRERTIEVKGKVNEKAKVSLNDNFVAVSGDGSFSTTFTLNEGANELTIKSADEAGNETEVKRTVTYKP